MNALLHANIIERSQVTFLHIQIEELMEVAGSRQGSKADYFAALKDTDQGPTISTKYMN